MIERREHYISAAYAPRVPDLVFSDLMRASEKELSKRKATNLEPPPEREVVLVLSTGIYSQVLASSLERVFGFVFEGALGVDGKYVRPEFLTTLSGLLKRVLTQNEIIEHYGFSVRLFIAGRSEEDLDPLYGVFDDLCSGVSKLIDFDILQDKDDLRVFLNSTFRRIVHGEKKAAYAGLKH